MKRVFFICVFLLVLCSSNVVRAEEMPRCAVCDYSNWGGNVSDMELGYIGYTETDDLNRCIEGSLAVYRYKSDENGIWTIDRILFYKVVADEGASFCLLENSTSSKVFKLKAFGGNVTMYEKYRSFDEVGTPVGDDVMLEYSTSATLSFCTVGPAYKYEYWSNIPVFPASMSDSLESTYFTDGNTDGVANSDYINDFAPEEDVFDESIPLPHGLKVLQGTDQMLTTTELAESVLDMYPTRFNRDIVIAWDQKDVIDGLNYEVEGCITYVSIGANDDGDASVKNYTSAYYPLVLSTAYDGKETISVTLTSSQLNTHQTADGIGDGLLSKMVIRVRNKNGSLTSNWVSITIDFAQQTATATEQSYDDSSVTGGDEYNDSDVTSGSSSGSGGSSNVSINGVMSFIRDGFGLLGNNGIIALLSSTFLYLPKSIWTMLKFLVAMMIATCIIKLVKDVVT